MNANKADDILNGFKHLLQLDRIIINCLSSTAKSCFKYGSRTG